MTQLEFWRERRKLAQDYLELGVLSAKAFEMFMGAVPRKVRLRFWLEAQRDALVVWLESL